jgi:hypothetical protein
MGFVMALGFHLTTVRMALIKKTNNKVGKGVGKKDPYTLLMGRQISPATMEISVEVPQEIKNRIAL